MAGRTQPRPRRASSCSAGWRRVGHVRVGAGRDWTRIAARLRAQYPATNAALGVTTDPLTDRVIGPTTERALWMLFGSVGFVLLIACANVANLVARPRVGAPQRVLAAHGARRERVAAGAAGADRESRPVDARRRGRAAVIAWGGTIALRTLAPGALPRAEGIHVDPASCCSSWPRRSAAVWSPACSRRCSSR